MVSRAQGDRVRQLLAVPRFCNNKVVLALSDGGSAPVVGEPEFVPRTLYELAVPRSAQEDALCDERVFELTPREEVPGVA